MYLLARKPSFLQPTIKRMVSTNAYKVKSSGKPFTPSYRVHLGGFDIPVL